MGKVEGDELSDDERGALLVAKVMDTLHKRARPDEIVLEVYAIALTALKADMDADKRYSQRVRCSLDDGHYASSNTAAFAADYADARAAINLLDRIGDKDGTDKQVERDQVDQELLRFLTADVSRGEPANYSRAEREFPLSRRRGKSNDSHKYSAYSCICAAAFKLRSSICVQRRPD